MKKTIIVDISFLTPYEVNMLEETQQVMRGGRTGYPTGASTDVSNRWTKAQAGAVITLTYSANIGIDASLGNNFAVAMEGDLTFDAPTNIQADTMQGGIIKVTQDPTGGRVTTFGANWMKVGTFSEDTSANKTALYQYTVIDQTHVLVQHLGDI